MEGKHFFKIISISISVLISISAFAAEAKRPDSWIRKGTLGPKPNLFTDEFPLSDQSNQGKWKKYELMRLSGTTTDRITATECLRRYAKPPISFLHGYTGRLTPTVGLKEHWAIKAKLAKAEAKNKVLKEQLMRACYGGTINEIDYHTLELKILSQIHDDYVFQYIKPKPVDCRGCASQYGKGYMQHCVSYFDKPTKCYYRRTIDKS